MKGRRLFSSVFAITETRDMDLYEMPMSMILLGFGMGTMLAKLLIPSIGSCGKHLHFRILYVLFVAEVHI